MTIRRRESGLLVALEGINGAGKTTLATRLQRRLRLLGIPVKAVAYPFHSPSGHLLRKAMTNSSDLSQVSLFALFAANRLETKSLVQESLQQGRIVVADRYSGSEYAYGQGHSLPLRWLEALESQMPRPDLVLLLDVSVETALERVARSGKRDRFEQDVQYMNRVRRAYLAYANAHRRVWRVLSANASADEVEAAAMQRILRRCGTRLLDRR